MSIESHLAELRRRHREIDDEIFEAMSHPSIDDTQIGSLKRRKLALKDAINRLHADPEAAPTQH